MVNMTMFRRILVPTDFGEPSGQALQMAIEMVRSSGGELIVLHVCEIPTYAYAEMSAAPIDLLTPYAELAQRKLDDLVASLRQQVPRVRSLLKLGVAWEQIVATVTEVSADLVIMGTHGRRGAAHAFLGSVAEKIIRMSPAPVLTVRPPAVTAGASRRNPAP
jgi:nucleotide-binding universal stress UspA family protein